MHPMALTDVPPRAAAQGPVSGGTQLAILVQLPTESSCTDLVCAWVEISLGPGTPLFRGFDILPDAVCDNFPFSE